MKSTIIKDTDVVRKWYLIDAEGKTLGRISTEIASYLSGKRKVTYTPHVDSGDAVIVINAEKVKVTGKKMEQKMYKSYSGYAGGLKETKLKDMLVKKPGEIIMHSVKGMLPKNRLGTKMLKRLKVCIGSDHKFEAQRPEVLA